MADDRLPGVSFGLEDKKRPASPIERVAAFGVTGPGQGGLLRVIAYRTGDPTGWQAVSGRDPDDVFTSSLLTFLVALMAVLALRLFEPATAVYGALVGS